MWCNCPRMCRVPRLCCAIQIQVPTLHDIFSVSYWWARSHIILFTSLWINGNGHLQHDISHRLYTSVAILGHFNCRSCFQVTNLTSSDKNCTPGSRTNLTEGTPSALQSLLIMNLKAQNSKTKTNTTNSNPNQSINQSINQRRKRMQAWVPLYPYLDFTMWPDNQN